MSISLPGFKGIPRSGDRPSFRRIRSRGVLSAGTGKNGTMLVLLLIIILILALGGGIFISKFLFLLLLLLLLLLLFR
jgi:hypothetical protein